MTTKKPLTLLLLALSMLCATAQPYCDVRTFSVRDGLAANTVSGFAQTSDGLMWFSTWNGLCFYDGDKFTTFRNRPGGGEMLTTNRVMYCRPNVMGSLWCATSDGHAYLFDTKLCQFVDMNGEMARRSGGDVIVRGIYPLSNGHTWIVGEGNSLCFRVDDRHLSEKDHGMEIFGAKYGNLANGVVKKVRMDGKGREWVFTDKGVQQPGKPICCADTVEYMASMGGNTFFATTDGRLYSCAGGKQKADRVELPGIDISRINAVKEVGGNTLALATDAGIVIYGTLAGKGNACRLVSVQSPSQPLAEVTDIFVDSRKRIWAFTRSDGVTLVDTRTWQADWLMARAASVMERTTSNAPFCHEDGSGTVWVIPRGGTFSYYCESESHLTPYRLSVADMSGRCLPMVNKHYADNDRNLWFTANAANHGASHITFKYHHFRFVPVMPNQEARSVFIDSQDRTWVGMYDGQLAVFDGSNRLLGYLNRDGNLQQEPVVFVPRIYAIKEDGQGRIWIATKGQGLFVVEGEGSVRQYVHTTDKYSLSSNDVYDIDIDRQGHVWVATFGGGINLVERSQDGGARFVNANNDMKQFPMELCYKVRRITHSPKGVVILSTTNGLVTFSDAFATADKIKFHVNRHNKGDEKGLMGNDVLQALVTSDGRALVVTLGGGVQQVEQSNLLNDRLTFKVLGGVMSAGDGMVQSLVEDNSGSVWGVCGSSLLCFPKAGGGALQYVPSVSDGYVELSEAKPAHSAGTDKVAVGVWGGVVCFAPNKLSKSSDKPKIVFTSVQYQGEQSAEPVLARDVLDVPSNRRNLTVYFSALVYGDRYLVKYAYKIDGVDKEWNFVGANNSVSFNKLPAGHHKLLVKSTNGDGVWVDNVTALDIYARPTFWETGWAWLLYIVVLCGIVYVIAYIYTLRAKNTMTREMGEMKLKFFAEIGHKLRTPLTLIGGPVAEVLKTESLSASAKRHMEMVQRNASQMLELVNKMLKYDGGDDTYISDDNISVQGVVAKAEDTHPMAEAESSDKSLRLLVVEDNDDLRAFLVGLLCSDYTVLQASNGQEGLDIAVREQPDFIITDVMMPVMDGLTMIHRIKQNTDTCHIPIIVLSAKASLEDRLQGLKEGIDDYITKPFSAIYLKSRINNIVSSRRALQQTYVEQIKPEDKKTYRLESPQIVDADNEMMKRLLGYLEKRIGDSSLKIEDCADAVNLGRSVFYGKIKSIVGMSPVDFVRHIRMQRAEELIAKSSYSFSQIAYMVGFSDPKYFSKCFKKDKGMTPSEYREKTAKGKTAAD